GADPLSAAPRPRRLSACPWISLPLTSRMTVPQNRNQSSDNRRLVIGADFSPEPSRMSRRFARRGRRMFAKRHRKLLLTGAAGGLGKVLRQKLKENCDVLRVSDIADLGPAGAGEEVVQADLADAAAVDA